MSKEGRCKLCKSGRCNECRGYRNGNKKLKCLCTHSREKPARTPQKPRLADSVLGEIMLARQLPIIGLPDRVSSEP